MAWKRSGVRAPYSPPAFAFGYGWHASQETQAKGRLYGSLHNRLLTRALRHSWGNPCIRPHEHITRLRDRP